MTNPTNPSLSHPQAPLEIQFGSLPERHAPVSDRRTLRGFIAGIALTATTALGGALIAGAQSGDASELPPFTLQSLIAEGIPVSEHALKIPPACNNGPDTDNCLSAVEVLQNYGGNGDLSLPIGSVAEVENYHGHHLTYKDYFNLCVGAGYSPASCILLDVVATKEGGTTPGAGPNGQNLLRIHAIGDLVDTRGSTPRATKRGNILPQVMENCNAVQKKLSDCIKDGNAVYDDGIAIQTVSMGVMQVYFNKDLSSTNRKPDNNVDPTWNIKWSQDMYGAKGLGDWCSVMLPGGWAHGVYEGGSQCGNSQNMSQIPTWEQMALNGTFDEKVITKPEVAEYYDQIWRAAIEACGGIGTAAQPDPTPLFSCNRETILSMSTSRPTPTIPVPETTVPTVAATESAAPTTTTTETTVPRNSEANASIVDGRTIIIGSTLTLAASSPASDSAYAEKVAAGTLTDRTKYGYLTRTMDAFYPSSAKPFVFAQANRDVSDRFSTSEHALPGPNETSRVLSEVQPAQTIEQVIKTRKEIIRSSESIILTMPDACVCLGEDTTKQLLKRYQKKQPIYLTDFTADAALLAEGVTYMAASYKEVITEARKINPSIAVNLVLSPAHRLAGTQLSFSGEFSRMFNNSVREHLMNDPDYLALMEDAPLKLYGNSWFDKVSELAPNAPISPQHIAKVAGPNGIAGQPIYSAAQSKAWAGLLAKIAEGSI